MARQPRPVLLPLAERLFRTRTVHDARRIARAIQLVATFGLLIVLPVLLLAYLALSTIQGGKDSLDAELAPRALAVTSQVRTEEGELFQRFEEQVRERLSRNQSPVTALDDLSPYLLAAYALDRQGRLVGPFDLPETRLQASPTMAYERAYRAGLQAQGAGALRVAAEHYFEAVELTPDPRLQGQARLAAARMLAQAGEDGAYADVIGEYGAIRDPRGFRVGDLARLKQAELAAARSPDGAFALRETVEFLLAARWTLLEAGEATVARRALERLETLRAQGVRVNPDWLAQARRRLARRTEQLFWSGRLIDELTEVIAEPPPAGGGFDYRTLAASPALWALVQTEDGLVVYAFDREAVLARLERTANRLAALDDDITARVTRAAEPVAGEAVFQRGLEHLPMFEVRVAAADPEAFARDRRNRTFARVMIILLALATSVVGIAVTVWYVTRELEAARVKTDFAANVSHELRSPITQIRLKGEALQLDLVTDDDDRRAHYDAIVRESERLSRLVDNVLDFAAIERGAKKYTFRPEDLVMLLHYAVETHRSAAEQAGMAVHLDVPDDLPVVFMDREAISQVLTNLLSNAIKYGADGGWLGVSARRIGGTVEVRVGDRGMGIEPEDQARIFEDFYRSADPAVRRRKGTGIGLTIVRYIVEAHGGTISVVSAPGEGATFVIHLPLQPPDGAGG
jgi:signal transduction histidine kinase